MFVFRIVPIVSWIVNYISFLIFKTFWRKEVFLNIKQSEILDSYELH